MTIADAIKALVDVSVSLRAIAHCYSDYAWDEFAVEAKRLSVEVDKLLAKTVGQRNCVEDL